MAIPESTQSQQDAGCKIPLKLTAILNFTGFIVTHVSILTSVASVQLERGSTGLLGITGGRGEKVQLWRVLGHCKSSQMHKLKCRSVYTQVARLARMGLHAADRQVSTLFAPGTLCCWSVTAWSLRVPKRVVKLLHRQHPWDTQVYSVHTCMQACCAM